MNLRHVVSVSGGKDSTALWLLALERGVDPLPVFADTGHEHQATYDYLEYLEQQLGPITRVKADFSRRFAVRRRNIARDQRFGRDKSGARIRWSNKAKRRALAVLHPSGIPFLDLCMLKGRFPSTRRRFCSQELKHLPIRAQVVDPLMDDGYTVVSWQGVRADESEARANAPIVDEPEEQLIQYRPLIHWTAADVFDMHRKHGIRPNPLYLMGAARVGCWYCIHARKEEVRNGVLRFPRETDRIETWERLVSQASKRGMSTFFAYDKVPGIAPNKANPQTCGIRVVSKWAMTTRGGYQFDLLASGNDAKECSSIYGLCE